MQALTFQLLTISSIKIITERSGWSDNEKWVVGVLQKCWLLAMLLTFSERYYSCAQLHTVEVCHDKLV